jgi:multidrug efflux system outer membrane protein
VVSPSASLPIFGSANHARVDFARARRDALVAAYESSIQAAFRDVADGLARAGTLDDQLAAQTVLVTAAERAYTLAESRFRTGIDSYLAALTAQRVYYSSQQSAVGVRLEAVANRIELYRAVGNDPSTAD